MAFIDLPSSELKKYRPHRVEPADFDLFWQRTLAAARAHPLRARFTPIENYLATIETLDVEFSGYNGQPVRGWLMLPRQRSGKLPCIVEFLGYGGGRGFPFSRILWSSAGYAHFIMDTRGQGGDWQRGDTPDVQEEGAAPHFPGFMTLGILAPETYYYRRLFTDAARAVEAALSHPEVDGARIAAMGGSQGGGISLAVAGLEPRVSVLMSDVPFLCHIRRATEITDAHPYQEIVRYCRIHRDHVDQIFHTLSYFDGMNFAPRAKARAFFSVGLMDDVCPPSTIYGAYNHYAGPKEIRDYVYNKHDGGGGEHDREKFIFLRKVW